MNTKDNAARHTTSCTNYFQKDTHGQKILKMEMMKHNYIAINDIIKGSLVEKLKEI